MLNSSKLIAVVYRGNQVRFRNCQSTVFPTKKELGPVTNINEWFLYLRFCADLQVKATTTFDTIVATESLIDQANHEILNPRSL